MGDNVEIYQRLGRLETETARLNERMTWMLRFMWLLFPSGGVVGWALSKIFGGG